MEAEKPAKRNTTKVKQKNVKESKLQSTERRRNKKQKQTERKEVDEPAPGGIYMRQDDECDTGDEGDDWDHSSVQGDDIGDEPAYFLSRLSTIALAEGIKDFTDELAKRTRK